MIGEYSIGGVYVPALLLSSVLSLGLTAFLSQLLTIVGAYRLVAYRSLCDLALLVLVFGGLITVSTSFGGRL